MPRWCSGRVATGAYLPGQVMPAIIYWTNIREVGLAQPPLRLLFLLALIGHRVAETTAGNPGVIEQYQHVHKKTTQMPICNSSMQAEGQVSC